MKHLFVIFILFLPLMISAQEDTTAVDLDISLEQKMRRNLVDLSIEDYVNIPADSKSMKLTFYGFLDQSVEKYFNTKGTEAYQYKNENLELTRPSFHLYGVSHLTNKVTLFFNLGHSSKDVIEIENVWGNFKFDEAFQLRIGKMYRRFDLFNERLDQTAAIIGIDPPELYDPSQYMVPILTQLMLHGNIPVKRSVFSYSLMYNNGESGAEKNVYPLGWDFRFKQEKFLVGTSGYLSNMDTAHSQSSVAFGEGLPKGSIRPWMSSEKYSVFGLFGESLLNSFSIKAGYFVAYHDADRNPENVLTIIQNVNLDETHRRRFLGNNATKPNGSLTTADVLISTNYTVHSFYIRMAYNVYTPWGQFIPYLFMDFIKNPEMIADVKYGGGAKIGLADDGAFKRPTIGLIYKPKDNIAVKSEYSLYNTKTFGKDLTYPEIRFQVAFMFK